MNEEKKNLRKLIAIAMVLAVAFTSISMERGISVSIEGKAAKKETRQETTKQKKEKEPTIVKELTDERTENSNTYLLSNGMKRKEIFAGNIRYQENGKLVDYDESIVKPDQKDKKIFNEKTDENVKDYAYTNESGDCKHFFPKELNGDHGIVTSTGKYVVNFIPEVKAENRETENDTNADKNGTRRTEETDEEMPGRIEETDENVTRRATENDKKTIAGATETDNSVISYTAQTDENTITSIMNIYGEIVFYR